MKFSEAPCDRPLLVGKTFIGFKTFCNGEIFVDIQNSTIYSNLDPSVEVELINDFEIHFDVLRPATVHLKRRMT